MVNLIDCSRSEFIMQASKKKLYCFGAGKRLQKFINKNFGIDVEAVIDNFRWTDDSPVYINNKAVKVISFDIFARQCDKNTAVVITCMNIEDVLKQLDSSLVCEGMDCYIDYFIEKCTDHTEIDIKDKPETEIIPRKIHYCWFGGTDIPQECQNYMATWKEQCPDYEIIRWDESNYDVHKNQYISDAYEQKKWAFVSDYARVDILYQEGGIYLDTDVELIAPLDEFLIWNLYCGFDHDNYVAWGLGIGSVQGHPILKKVLEIYERMCFVQKDGSLNLKTCPVIQSEVMEQFGFEMNGKFQERGGIAIYPREFFDPIQWGGFFGRITEASHSIHHYAASWFDDQALIYLEKYGERIRKIKRRNN